jgi:signal transduction histidine kinase
MTRRLLLSYLIVAAIVLLVLEVPLAVFYQQRETDRLSVDVERDATVLAGYYEDALERGTTSLNPTFASRYAARTGARVVVVDKTGRSLVDTSGAVHRDFSSRPEILAALAGRIDTGTRHSNTLGTDLLYVTVPVASGGHVHGVLRLTMDTHAVSALVHRFWLGLVGVAVVALAAIAGIGWAVAHSVNRPLRTLHAAAARFATGDLTPVKSDRDAPREIAALGATMNTMAHRLDHLMTEHRAFVADASHQLRTPLTALRLRLENLQSDRADCDVAGDLGAAIDETNRLAVLVGDLLKLARAEETATAEPVDLVGLVRDRVDIWSAFADGADVTLDLTVPSGSVVVSAVTTGVEQMLDNLIDNAIAASPAHSRVHVSVARGQGEHRLSIADEGPGLTDEVKARALERFWRLDHSKPGTGLGLPIALAFAEASGGSLVLEDSPVGGLAVIVTLPAAGSRDTPRSAETRSRESRSTRHHKMRHARQSPTGAHPAASADEGETGDA